MTDKVYVGFWELSSGGSGQTAQALVIDKGLHVELTDYHSTRALKIQFAEDYVHRDRIFAKRGDIMMVIPQDLNESMTYTNLKRVEDMMCWFMPVPNPQPNSRKLIAGKENLDAKLAGMLYSKKI